MCVISKRPLQLGQCFPFRTFLFENCRKWSLYASGGVRLSQWKNVVVLNVVRFPVFTRPPLNRSWFGGDI